MAGDGRLQADPLFQGLTRPAMLMGVSYMYFVVNAIVTLLSFIWTKNPLILFLVAPVVHMIGYMLCMHEPRIIEMTIVKFRETWKCRNRMHFGLRNSYDVF